MAVSRRSVCAAMPALMLMTRAFAQEKKTIPSGIFNFDQLKTQTSGSLTSRNMVKGMLYENVSISLHESDLAPHSAPHPPHHHRHEEMVLVVEGTLEFTVNGATTRAGEGSVLFAGTNDVHGIFNPEDTHAKYFVLALGPDDQ